MTTIRTFFMQNTILKGTVYYSGAEELVEPTNFGELTPEGFIVFAEIKDDRLYSVTIHNGLPGVGLLTSHYGKTAWLVARKVPVAIGTSLADIRTMPELENTIYEPFFEEVFQLLQNTTEENRKVSSTPHGVLMSVKFFLEPSEEGQEQPQSDPVS